MSSPDDYEQRYDPMGTEPVRVWVFCRLCRCRMQVRTLPHRDLPFRCFCGAEGTLSSFDVFSDEEEVRRFVGTYEDIYQTTKNLLKDAAMPMPATRIYKADEIRRLKQAASDEGSALENSEESPPADPNAFRKASRDLADAVAKARDVLERHEALGQLARFAFANRGASAEARRLAYDACETDVKIARDVLREATARFKQGQRVALKFPAFKRLIAMLIEDQELPRALEVASRAVQLGLPGYEEKVDKLRAQIARRA